MARSLLPLPTSSTPPMSISRPSLLVPASRCSCFGLQPKYSSSSSALSAAAAVARRAVVVRAGPPTTNNLILAFVLPFSLLAGTIFTAARVADRLDEKYLEELAMNEALMEEREAGEALMGDRNDEYEEENVDWEVLVQTGEESAMVTAAASTIAPRVRNRPKRQV